MNDGKLIADQLSTSAAITQFTKLAPVTIASNTAPPAIKTFKPEQGQLFRTADKKLIAFTGDKNVVLSAPVSTDRTEKGPQIIQLSSDELKNLQKGPNQIQFVKVVNSAGLAQTLPIQLSSSLVSKPATTPIKANVPTINEGVANLDSTIRELQQIKREQSTDQSSASIRVKKPCNCTKSQCLKVFYCINQSKRMSHVGFAL